MPLVLIEPPTVSWGYGAVIPFDVQHDPHTTPHNLS
jgi:hypothetical protein